MKPSPVEVKLEFKGDAPIPEGMKFDGEKVHRFSLLPFGVLNSVLEVLHYGAKKYKAWNWLHVKDGKTRYFDAAMRHLTAWWQGEQIDPESGMPHLSHALCNLFFLAALDGGKPPQEWRGNDGTSHPLTQGEQKGTEGEVLQVSKGRKRGKRI